jgi:hypothetical protein
MPRKKLRSDLVVLPRDAAVRHVQPTVAVSERRLSDPTRPFGGYKESGFGREGERHGLLPYVTLS